MNYYEIDPKKCANESHAGYMYAVVWTGNGMYVTEKPVTIGVTVSAIIADEDLSPYMKKILSIPNTRGRKNFCVYGEKSSLIRSRYV